MILFILLFFRFLLVFHHSFTLFSSLFFLLLQLLYLLFTLPPSFFFLPFLFTLLFFLTSPSSLLPFLSYPYSFSVSSSFFYLSYLLPLPNPFSHHITFPPLPAPTQFKPASSLTSLTDRVTYIATKKIREKKKNQPETFQVISPYTANSKDTGTGDCTGTIDGHSTVILDVACVPFQTGDYSNLNYHLILLLCCLFTDSQHVLN